MQAASEIQDSVLQQYIDATGYRSTTRDLRKALRASFKGIPLNLRALANGITSTSEMYDEGGLPDRADLFALDRQGRDNVRAIDIEADSTKYAQAVAKTLKQVQSAEDKLRIARSAVRNLKRNRTQADVESVSFSQLITYLMGLNFENNIVEALQEAGEGVKSQLAKFFVMRNKKFIYKRPAQAERRDIQSDPQGRVAARIAKMIRARIQLGRLSKQKLTDEYIDKRSKLSAAARTGSASVMIQKYTRGLKQYGTAEPDTILARGKQRLAEGQKRAAQVIENKMAASTANLKQFNQEKYTAYKLAKEQFGITSDTVTDEYKRLFDMQ